MATNAVYLPGGEISSTSGSPSPATSIKGEIFSGKASEKSIHLGDNKYSELKLNSRQLLRAMKSTSAMILFATASAIVSAAPRARPPPPPPRSSPRCSRGGASRSWTWCRAFCSGTSRSTSASRPWRGPSRRPSKRIPPTGVSS